VVVLGGRDHAQRPVEPAVAVPVDPAGGGVFDVGEDLVGTLMEEAGG